VAEPALTAPLRILVIDDEPHILHYMRATLEAWGHGVEVAGDGEAGLELAVAGGFDLILSDLRMPRLTGREFFAALMERNPEAASRVVFSTGDTVHGDTTAFLEGQAHPFLNKPFSLAELRALLARAAPAARP
jgi:CheY-like chemotaxis protein